MNEPMTVEYLDDRKRILCQEPSLLSAPQNELGRDVCCMYLANLS